MTRLLLPFYCFALLAHTAHAGERSIDNLSGLTQQQFKSLGQDLGAALHYKSLSPAEPLGLLGVDVGVEASTTKLSHSEIFALVNEQGNSPDSLLLTRLHAHKGLPFGWDIGASYSLVPDSNLKMLGAEIRYSVWEGNVIWPALAIRGSYAQLNGTEVLDMNSKALELTASKGFLMFTPYAGIGYVWSNLDPQQTGLSLDSETIEQHKIYVGSHLNILGMNAGLEVENTDGRNTLSFKLSIRF